MQGQGQGLSWYRHTAIMEYTNTYMCWRVALRAVLLARARSRHIYMCLLYTIWLPLPYSCCCMAITLPYTCCAAAVLMMTMMLYWYALAMASCTSHPALALMLMLLCCTHDAMLTGVHHSSSTVIRVHQHRCRGKDRG